MGLPITEKKFIEVQTPITVDGMNPKYDANHQVQYKTTFLPITAKRELERNAARKPERLRPKITVKSGDADTPELPATGKQSKKILNDDNKQM